MVAMDMLDQQQQQQQQDARHGFVLNGTPMPRHAIKKDERLMAALNDWSAAFFSAALRHCHWVPDDGS